MKIEMRRKWQRLADAQEKSGLSVDEFCAQHKICSTHFYTRRKELRVLRKDQPRSGFIKLTTGNTSPNNSKQIFPVQNIQPRLISRLDSLPVRIQTPNGYSVEAVVAGDHGLAEVFGLLKAL